MLEFNNLVIESAVANPGEVMEADTISKNGWSSKSHTSKTIFLLISMLFPTTLSAQEQYVMAELGDIIYHVIIFIVIIIFIIRKFIWNRNPEILHPSEVKPRYQFNEELEKLSSIETDPIKLHCQLKYPKEFVPIDGENVLTQIEGNAWSSSPNPLVSLISSITKFFSAIIGVKRRTFIIVTNLRIVKVEKKTILWGILPGTVDVFTLNKTTIQSVGYSMRSSWFIFRKWYFILANMNGSLLLTYKGNKDKLIESCAILDKVVAQK